MPIPRRRLKGDYKYVLHRGTLRSIVGLDKPAGALFDRSIYEFANPQAVSSGKILHPAKPLFQSHLLALSVERGLINSQDLGRFG